MASLYGLYGRSSTRSLLLVVKSRPNQMTHVWDKSMNPAFGPNYSEIGRLG